MPDNSSSNKRIATNTIFLSIRMVVVLAITLFTTRVILRVLGVVDYGVYNVVCGFVSMFVFLNTSMSNGIQRFFNYEFGKHGEEGANTVFCTAIYIQAILAIIVVVIIEIIGLWYLHNKMVIPADRMVAAEWIFQFSLLTFVFGIMQAPFSAAVVAHERLDFYAVVSVFDAILKLGIVYLLMIIPADKLIVYGILSSLIVIINILIYYIYCKKNFKEIRFHRGLDRELFKNMLGFSGWNLFGSFSSVMETQGINLVMNFFYGPVVNAARGVANQINSGVQSFVQNVTIPVRPQVTQSYASGDIQRTMNLTYGVSKISSAIILMIAVPAAIEIDYVLHLWLGENVPDHTAMFTVLILLTSLVGNLNAPISNVVHASGIMRDYQMYGSIVRVCSVPIAFILIKLYDIPELGLLAVLSCTILNQIVCLIIAKKIVHFSLRDYALKVAVPIFFVFLLSVVLVGFIHVSLPQNFFRLVLACVVSIFVVGLAFYYIAFNENERKLSLQLLSPFLSKLKRK